MTSPSLIEPVGHPDQMWGGLTYSQSGEDLMVCNLFWQLGIENPSYLDIGAHHPTRISNTALLYQRGSRGINIEANPNLIQEFERERPGDQNINFGVGPREGILDFYMIDEESGRNTFSKETAERFCKEHPQFTIREVRPVQVLTINTVLDNFCGGVYPDFLSIDVEGLDLEILFSANFYASRPKVLCVEAVTRSEQLEILRLLDSRIGNGISTLFHFVCKMGSNLIFVDARLRTVVDI